MRSKKSSLASFVLPVVLLLGCAPTLTSTDVVGEVEPAAVADSPTEMPRPTPEPLMMPEFTIGEMEVIVTKAERDARGLIFWPDGNIGVLRVDDTYAFFAPDARTTGSLDAPAQGVDVVEIQGVDPEYTYAAGGPIYSDPASGALLLFYHAEIAPAPGLDYSWHYSLIGVAISQDSGFTFHDLGEIIRPESEQGTRHDIIRDVAGGTYIIRDDYFYVYSRDFPAAGGANHLTVARAPAEEVVQAALEGGTVEWWKYYEGEFSEPGRGGKSSPLELGNPEIGWMGAAYNSFLDAYIMVVSHHNVPGSPVGENLHLITSPDGIHWSPRVEITSGTAENAYPTIVGLNDDSLASGESFYIYNSYSDIGGVHRWDDARLVRRVVTLTGMVEAPRRWDFDTDGDAEGWVAQNQLEPLAVSGGNLVTQSLGNDPYMGSPRLAISAQAYPLMEVRMKVSGGFAGQVFFTTHSSPLEGEEKSFRFDVAGDGEFHTYMLDMFQVEEWRGVITGVRIDPIQTEGLEIEIDYVEFTSP